MLKRPNPTLAKPAMILNPEKLAELGIAYGTQDMLGRPHIVMTRRDWARASRAKAVQIHEHAR